MSRSHVKHVKIIARKKLLVKRLLLPETLDEYDRLNTIIVKCFLVGEQERKLEVARQEDNRLLL